MAALHEHPDLLNNADSTSPGLPNYGSQNSYRTTGSSSCVRRSRRISSMRFEAAGSGRRTTSSPTSRPISSRTRTATRCFPIVNNAAFITGCHRHQPGAAQHDDVEHRQHAELAQGRHSFTMGGGYAGVLNRAEQLQPSCRHPARLRHEHRSGGQQCSTPPTSRGAAAQLTEARTLYALLTGRVLSIAGTARLDRPPASTSTTATCAQVAAVQLLRVRRRIHGARRRR